MNRKSLTPLLGCARWLHSSISRVSSQADVAVISAGDELDNDLIHTHISKTRPKVHFVCHTMQEQVSLPEALRCLRAYSLCPSSETVEISVNVNMALKKNKRKDAFRGTLVYPHRFGEERRVLLLAEEDVLSEAKGADLSGGNDLIKKLERNPSSFDFDVCLCTPTVYEEIGHLQKTLRAKMPNPRRGTVVSPEKLNEAIVTFQQSKTFKCIKEGVVNMAVGKLDFQDAEIEANIKCLLDSIAEHRGALMKSVFLEGATLSSNFGPGFEILIQDLL